MTSATYHTTLHDTHGTNASDLESTSSPPTTAQCPACCPSSLHDQNACGNAEEIFVSSSGLASSSRYSIDEETPLLHRKSRQPDVEYGSEQMGALLEPGLDPSQSGRLTKSIGYSSSKAAAVDDNDHEDQGPLTLPGENESPYLGGISKKRFWVFYSGVLLQYFVHYSLHFPINPFWVSAYTFVTGRKF